MTGLLSKLSAVGLEMKLFKDCAQFYCPRRGPSVRLQTQRDFIEELYAVKRKMGFGAFAPLTSEALGPARQAFSSIPAFWQCLHKGLSTGLSPVTLLVGIPA
jgi:hypothetical protein